MDTAITVNGNITRDLELRETTDGTPVLTIPLACSRRRKVGDEWTEELPGYHDVVVFRKTAEHAAATFAKGDRVLAHGRLNQGDYTDRDGSSAAPTKCRPTSSPPTSPSPPSRSHAPSSCARNCTDRGALPNTNHTPTGTHLTLRQDATRHATSANRYVGGGPGNGPASSGGRQAGQARTP